MSTPIATMVQKGDEIDYTPGSAVNAGDVVNFGTFIGIATHPIVANVVGALAIRGVFDVNKESGEVWAVGDKLGWDATNKVLSHLSAYYGTDIVAICVRAAASGDATGRALLTPGASQ